jgi:hypothetical protein
VSTDPIALINIKIDELVNDKYEYNFDTLKEKVEDILKSVDVFMIDNEVNTKAVDMYLKTVITQKNNIKKEQEKTKIDNTKETKYTLIEEICKKYEFETQEQLIKKIDELEMKTNLELSEINKLL